MLSLRLPAFSSLNMPAAVMHLTVLVSLFAVANCTDPTSSTVTATTMKITTSAAQSTSVTATKTNNASLSTEDNLSTITNYTQQPPTATWQYTSTVLSEKVSSSPPPLTSPQTPTRTEETQTSPPPQTTMSNQTSNETVSHGPSVQPGSESPTVTGTTTNNTTTPGFSHEWDKGDLPANPGLVAVLCIFCIAFVLVLVIVTVKCIRSPRANFERLADVPMEKVSETSPFAQHSK